MAEGNPNDVGGFQGQGGTQTPGGGSGAGGSDTKPKPGEAGGTGTGGDSGAGGDQDGPDADGKYTHPDTKTKVDASEMVKYYRDKFGASTAGAQALLAEKTALSSDLDTSKAGIAKLEKEMADLRALADGKNPEGLKAADIQKRLDDTAEKLALVTEEASLDKFERTNPLAAQVRDALKALARSNPKDSLQKLYDANLKAGVEATEAKRVADEEARKKGQSDSGAGTSTREPGAGGDTVQGPKGDTGLTQAEFDKLPVAERGRLLSKIGL